MKHENEDRRSRCFISAACVCAAFALAVGCAQRPEPPSANSNGTALGGATSGALGSSTTDGSTTTDTPTASITRPLAFFAVHGDPQHADQRHFEALQQIVEAASSRNVKLSIQFTPQWVVMMTSPGNEWMVQAFQSWMAASHDFGGHHHQITHDAAWDGYSNDAATMSSTRDPGYLGDLEDHLAVVQQLVAPAAITNYSGGEPDD
ncbi:MAG: hypothetical protein ACE5E5_00950 [Phycisphaerae bacterium]